MPITWTVREPVRNSSRPPDEYSGVVTSKVFPIGSSPGKNRFAVASLITATGAPKQASSIVNGCPRMNGISSAEKYSGRHFVEAGIHDAEVRWSAGYVRHGKRIGGALSVRLPPPLPLASPAGVLSTARPASDSGLYVP